jgi:hypothetical protein
MLLAPSQQPAQLSPYQSPLPRTQVELAAFQDFVPPLTANNQAADPQLEPQSERRLPPLFAISRPDLVGSVVAIDTREQTNNTPDIAGALFALLAEIIWIVPNSHAGREGPDRVEITRVRIQTDDGTRWDATLRGTLQGANLAMGDEVSLWGRRRRGNLLVSKGYDHTSQSPISTNGGGRRIFPLILLLFVGVGLYLYISAVSLPTALHQVQGFGTWIGNLLPFHRK